MLKSGQRIRLRDLFGRPSKITGTVLEQSVASIDEYIVKIDDGTFLQQYHYSWLYAINDPNDILKQIL